VSAGEPFDVARDAALGELPERDRRLAHELSAGVLRRQTALDSVLAPLVPRGLVKVDPRVRSILRLGAYQLSALDRVPRHAAVSTSVSLARESAGARAAGFVNAVLRRLPPEPVRPEPATGDAATDLAHGHSHPLWLVRRWLDRFGPAETEALLQWNNTRPVLVIQPARADLTALQERCREAGVVTTAAPFGAGLLVATGRPGTLPGYQSGDFVVQDPAHALVVRYAGIAEGGVVYDACAAPGGKTVALGRTGGRVIAGDPSRPRARRLRENLLRAGRGVEFVVIAQAEAPPLRAVDAVVLDAPCLGTGTFARHPDARWRARPEALRSLRLRQRALLEGVAPVVRRGGLLVYATCSLEPEENQQQIASFLVEHPDFRREPGSGVPSTLLSSEGDLVILPQRHQMDGAFAARLRRTA
jgi:16S rRNA (cytosine967-C5)-methyltransferase